jgi:4-diphosphocytidyl-2-C-methyl-D-erythritol kinase
MITYRSYAKINLGLEVLYKRPDGFHEIDTIFQTISLHDRMIFNESSELIVSCDREDIPSGPENLVYKAAEALREETGTEEGIEIRIEKRIPSGGGLGGGSSNAAVALIALNKIWGTNYSDERLMDIGAGLGSDVPFFFIGGTARARGRGEIITPIDDQEGYRTVLATPPLSISTPDAYNNLSKLLTSLSRPTNISAFVDGRKEVSSLTNDFEVFLFAEYPLLEDITEKFNNLGALKAGVTGSGAVVFGLFLSGYNPDIIARSMASSFPEVDFSASAPVTRDEYHRLLIE